MLRLIIVLCFFGVTRLAPLVEQGLPTSIPAPSDQVHFKMMDGSLGTYEFGYDTGVVDRGHQSYRYENRSGDGKVQGKYGYIAPDGILREVHYAANTETGFRSFIINRYPVIKLYPGLVARVKILKYGS